MGYIQVKNKIRQSLFTKIMTQSLITISLLSYSAQAFYYQDHEDKGHLVSVERAKTEQVNPTMWLPGNVISRKNSPISAELTGQLLWVEDVGKQVAKGDVLATIDNRHLTLQLARQQAQVKQHQANVSYLSKQKKRLSKLNQKNNTSLSELERIIKDLAIAKNEVVALEMQVKQTELEIEKSSIKAPFSGNISQRFAHVGELITLGRPLVQLVDTKHLDIKVSAPLAIAQFIQADAQVLVKWQDKLIELPVRTWSKAGDQQSRTFEVRLAADDLNLISGSAVSVSLPKQTSKQATMVPRDALVLREKETFVLTVNDDNQAKKVNVLVGQGVGRWVSVLGALDAGDEVIVRGGERLSDGQKVRKDQTFTVTASTN
ncbi:efflux RND transporter periplasmic adaptor subunit [Colwellia sp. 1_MG-2023]|uniref:efflux RND transporter periplasmic adaptor subunit n=1 Tax=Colwellia sp. 1_MG-2023 TaxID=3062649 RepID=UPI0026E3EA27|nr:efflux RND transporter periplasmic adaptor subunit [Colwellia sp. 1_MG-2023]MDO6446836.1 efflux RND transporter periplasmic adaptor subunit [Colwellia sp. 1_MG-2023]